MHEAMRVKPKMQWRTQDFGDVRNVECLPNKTVILEYSHPKREAMWAATGKAIGMGLPKPVGTHVMIPHVPDVPCGDTGFHVYSGRFWFCSAPILVILCSSLLEWKHLLCAIVFFFFAMLEFELRVFSLSHSSSPFSC
jgi:hypothetical protein